jgi:hypothetical protein
MLEGLDFPAEFAFSRTEAAPFGESAIEGVTAVKTVQRPIGPVASGNERRLRVIRGGAVADEHREQQVRFEAEASPEATAEVLGVLAKIVRTLRTNQIEPSKADPPHEPIRAVRQDIDR